MGDPYKHQHSNPKNQQKEKKRSKTYQSNGIGTAPNHAPTAVPNAPPQTVSIGRSNAQTCRQTTPSTPWTYTNGRTHSSAMCAAQRNVCHRCVVQGAPKRMRRMARTGVPRRAVRRRERNEACNIHSTLIDPFFYRLEGRREKVGLYGEFVDYGLWALFPTMMFAQCSCC